MTWTDCTRCPRHEHRFAVRSLRWPPTAQVVLLTSHASRTEQACGGLAPRVARLRESIQAAFGFSEDQVIADSLAACGIGAPRPGDVAACSRRFLDQSATPTVVVLIGKATAALARLAGLLDQSTWQPVGTAPVSAIVTEHEDAIAALSAYLRQAPSLAPPQPRAALSLLAPDLYRTLGPCEGYAVKKPGKEWVRSSRRGLRQTDVCHHLEGRHWVAPFRPRGLWPFVVLDIDRHDAIQEQCFAQTMTKLMALLPNSFVAQSSESGGRHVYVRLPDDVRYDNATTWLRAYLLLHEVRFAEKAAAGKRLRSELVEVKNHPPRLPFGLGSVIPGSALPLEAQLRQFLAWVNTSDSGDYNKAHEEASKEFSAPRRWNYTTLKRVTAAVLEREAGPCEHEGKLQPNDPWLGVHASLPKHLRGVVLSGIPAYGTRTAWTTALIATLSDHVDEPTAHALVEHWLRTRRHQSEDVAEDLEQVVREAHERVTKHYNRVQGVPVRIWSQIEHLVNVALREARLLGKDRFPYLRNSQSLVSTEALATAFFVARGYFEAGVRQRQVPEREFAAFCGKNQAHDMQELLTWSSGWLYFSTKAVPQVSARSYELSFWPALPGEPALVVPPFALPPRSKAG